MGVHRRGLVEFGLPVCGRALNTPGSVAQEPPRRRKTRRLNTEPQSWLHSGAGETLARKSPAGAGLSQRMRACPEGGKSTDTIPQAVARRTRDSRRFVGRGRHRTRGLGGGGVAPPGASQRVLPPPGGEQETPRRRRRVL